MTSLLSDTNDNKIELFDGISEKELHALLPCLNAHEKEFRKGDFIFLQDDLIRNIGVVLKGTVLMLKEDIWGNQTVLTWMKEGEIFGETFAVRKEQTSSVSFEASSDCRVLFLSFDHILHTCKRSCPFHHQIIENMMDIVSTKNIQLMEKIEVTSKPTLREKILSYLSILGQKQAAERRAADADSPVGRTPGRATGNDADFQTVVVPLGRSELASYLNANRSALTRELTAMKEDGIIDYSKNTFLFRNSTGDRPVVFRKIVEK